MLPDESDDAVTEGVLPSSPVTASLDAARASWERGDMCACLSVLDTLRSIRSRAQAGEAQLLRARALYRLKRYAETIALLEPILGNFAVGDEQSTARMLHAGAIARAGDVTRGLALLSDLAADAERHDVHPAIRGEIAFTRALAHWTGGELVQAERHAAQAEAAHADVISVRATHLLGFAAIARGSYHEALLFFRAAQEAYWRCRHRDRELIEVTVLEIASLELTLRSKGVPGSHAHAESRRVHDDTAAPPAPTIARMQTFACDAWLYALDGDTRAAYQLMREASKIPTAPAWQVWTLAGRAAVALAFGERLGAADHAGAALSLVDGVAWDETHGEERVGLLLLAEVMATTHPAESTNVLARYTALRSPIEPGEVLARDARLRALEDHVHGVVARAGGDTRTAAARLESAAAQWTAVGNRWRAALALIELAGTATARARDAAAANLTEARRSVQANFPRSFLAARTGLALEADPIARTLAPAQREVLSLVLAGFDGAEIARGTRRSYHTIHNHVSAIRAAFEARSLIDLIAMCARRGLFGEAVGKPLSTENVATAAARPRRRPPR
jgi:DNA-binding NarL/FixJ family response regulator